MRMIPSVVRRRAAGRRKSPPRFPHRESRLASQPRIEVRRFFRAAGNGHADGSTTDGNGSI